MSQHRYEQPKLHIDDLDHNEIYRAVEQGIAVNRVPANLRSLDIRDILIHWELLKENGVLNNAAAVLFAKKVTPGYLQCHIKLGRFKGKDMLGDFIDNKDFYGNAFQILEEADQFIRRHLPIASFFKSDQFERIDKPTLPVLAVREALVNAICHRDYSNHASSMTLAIFDDRMEIWSNGKLPPSLSINDLKKKHKSEPRNKVIAKVFYDRKYFDGWGMGISKIFELCREADVPEPSYEQYSGGVEISFKFKESIDVVNNVVNEIPALSIRQEQILSIIKRHESAGTREILEELENPPSQRMIQKDLKLLKELGLVDSTGVAKKTLWIFKK